MYLNWLFLHLQQDLIARGICSKTKAQNVVQERCLPLVGQRQSSFEKHLENMDVSLWDFDVSWSGLFSNTQMV